jgi:uncharacterized membrane protein YecN with MAPEG domain
MLLPVTLSLAATAALINLWLGFRCGQLRTSLKISVGDGGNEALTRRMRAQLNFAEYVPVALILIGAIEVAGKGGQWLAPVGGLFMLGRVLHALGMDGGSLGWARSVGISSTMLISLGLAVTAVLVAISVI